MLPNSHISETLLDPPRFADIHGTFGDVVKDWELASPITYVRKVAAEILKDKSGAAESAPAPAPSSVVSGSSAATSSIETPLSPPREQKDELLTEFGDPLASPRRGDEDDGTKQANDEQRELLETATPPIVSVIGSYKDAANNAEHLTVDLIGSKNHCTTQHPVHRALEPR
jgi:malate/lactate dehydrogenase